MEGHLYYLEDMVLLRCCLDLEEVITILTKLKKGMDSCHFFAYITIRKFLHVWYGGPLFTRIPWIFVNLVMNVKKMKPNNMNMSKLVTTLPLDPFTKWGLNFVCPIKPIGWYINNKYNLTFVIWYGQWTKTISSIGKYHKINTLKIKDYISSNCCTYY
jgi:hypothetical protein